MEDKWIIYRQELVKSSRSLVFAIGVSLLFFLASLPQLRPGEHWRSLLASLAHGFFIFFWIWVLYAIAHALITQGFIKSGRQMRINWPLHVTLGFAGMGLGLISAKGTLAWLLGFPFSLNSLWESLVIGAFIALMFQFYYAYKNSMAENSELRVSRMAAELQVLKNQMQPHFLFNSLNTLAELIESNKAHASTMTQNLADLYREILENSKLQVAPLSTELSIIRKYLELEKLRFGDRLNYEIIAPKNTASIYIPALMLQTLVENAVKHGISPSITGGFVQVSIKREEAGYRATVLNSGQSRIAPVEIRGTGIANTKTRLDLLYGSKSEFKLDIQPEKAETSFWFSGEIVEL